MHPLEGPLELKIYADPSCAPRARDLVPIFHRWIQAQCLENELLIDVADYSHVHRGPGVLLMGRDARYGFDESDGRPGLTVRGNGRRADDGEHQLRDVSVRAFLAASLLTQERALSGTVRFTGKDLRFRIHDRLRARHRDNTHDELARTLRDFFQDLFEGEVSIVSANRLREPFTVRIECPRGAGISKAIHGFGESSNRRSI